MLSRMSALASSKKTFSLLDKPTIDCLALASGAHASCDPEGDLPLVTSVGLEFGEAKFSNSTALS